MSTKDDPSARERWARLRLMVIGQLLAAPPIRGDLIRRLTELSRQDWRHPLSGCDVRFGVSTLERWLALARRSPDPAKLLATVPRADLGSVRVIGAQLAAAIHEQYALHPKWHVQLHYDNLLCGAPHKRFRTKPLARQRTSATVSIRRPHWPVRRFTSPFAFL